MPELNRHEVLGVTLVWSRRHGRLDASLLLPSQDTRFFPRCELIE